MQYIRVLETNVEIPKENTVLITIKYMIDEQIYEELTFSIIGEESIGQGE